MINTCVSHDPHVRATKGGRRAQRASICPIPIMTVFLTKREGFTREMRQEIIQTAKTYNFRGSRLPRGRSYRRTHEREKKRAENEELLSILLVNTEIPFPRANTAGTSFVVFTLIFDASLIRHTRPRFDFFFSVSRLDPAFAPAIVLVFVPRPGARERETQTRMGHKNPLSTSALFHAKIC